MEFVDVMLASREASLKDIFDRMSTDGCYMEYKYDGMRMQAHLDKVNKKVKLFSRGGKDITNMFKDVAYALLGSLKVDNAIVDGEIVAYDPETNCILPFQTVMHRKRKKNIEETMQKVAVKVYLYDVLYEESQDVTYMTYNWRKDTIRKLFDEHKIIDYAVYAKITNEEEANAFFDEAVMNYCEGVIAKKSLSSYICGGRNKSWIKFKKDYDDGLKDSFDLVIIGADWGEGKRAGVIGSLLVATKDGEEWCSVSKIGTGFSDADLKELTELLTSIKIDKPDNYNTKVKADIWVQPKYVAEINGADLSISPVHTAAKSLNNDKGLAIRFARYMGLREDKTPEQCTSPEEIYQMYQMQENRGKNP